MKEAPPEWLCTPSERAALVLLRAGRPISTTMLCFHLQQTAGTLVFRLKGMQAQGWVTCEAKGTPQRPALEWTITEAGRALVEATDEDGRAKA